MTVVLPISVDIATAEVPCTFRALTLTGGWAATLRPAVTLLYDKRKPHLPFMTIRISTVVRPAYLHFPPLLYHCGARL